MASKSEAQKAAMREVRGGKPRQEVFESYQSQVRPEKHLAFSIASVADPARQQKGAKLNSILFGLLVLAAVTKAVLAISYLSISPVAAVIMFALGVAVPIAMALGVRRFDGQIYPLLILLAGVGAANSLVKVSQVGPVMLLDAAMLVVIGVLAFRVQRTVFPNINMFSVRKDTQGNYVW